MVLAALWLASPLSAAPRCRLGQPASFAPPPADSASLYVVREQFVRTRALSPEEIYLDGAPLGLLPQRAFVAASVAPGRRVLWGLAGMTPLGLSCRAGHGYLVRLRETIDDRDQLHMEWLLDDPARIEILAQGVPLSLATTTPKGLQSMDRKPPRAVAEARDSSDALPLTFGDIWLEDPLRPESVRPSFRRTTWRAVVDSSGLLLTSKEKALAVPIADVTAIRFAGVREGGDQPWLDREYQAAGAQREVLIADSTPETSVRTYNRLFAALRDLWLARGGGGPGVGGAGDGSSKP